MIDLTQLDLSHLTDPHLSTARNIISYYQGTKQIEGRTTDKAGLWKSYFILAYNLFDVGFPDEAIYLLNYDVDPIYYSHDHFGKDFEYAVAMRQEAENYKNNPNDALKLAHCMQEAELVIVFGDMINRLQYTPFDHQDVFVNFLKTLVGNKYTVELKPKIELVKD